MVLRAEVFGISIDITLERESKKLKLQKLVSELPSSTRPPVFHSALLEAHWRLCEVFQQEARCPGSAGSGSSNQVCLRLGRQKPRAAGGDREECQASGDVLTTRSGCVNWPGSLVRSLALQVCTWVRWTWEMCLADADCTAPLPAGISVSLSPKWSTPPHPLPALFLLSLPGRPQL